MKILYIMGGGDIGGARTHIMSLCDEMDKINKVKLISFRHGSFAEEMINHGIDTAVLPSVNILSVLFALKKITKEFMPDVIHCHGGRANMMGAMLKLFTKAPIVTTIHSDYKLDYLGNPLKQYTFGLINTLALRCLDYFQPVADRMNKTLISRRFDPQKLYTIYNGLDFTKVSPKVDRETYLNNLCGAKVNKNDVLCGVAARLTAVKDLETAIRGFAHATLQNDRLKFFIAGTGEDETKLRKLCDELGVAERVFFCGWVSPIDSFFSAMDITLLSSLSETFPYTVTEGIREGCVPVSSDVGGMNELIMHGIGGYIFPPRDDKALGQALISLCDDEKRNKMAKYAYERAKTYFSLNAMMNTQLDIYNRIIERHARRGRQGVLVCGAYGKGNAGDDAILQAIVREMREIDRDMPIYVLSRRPRETRLVYKVNSLYTFNMFKFAYLCSKFKLYINGGGSLIQDVTSTRSLYYYLFTLFTAKLFGTKVIMYGCGIGPVSRQSNRDLATKVINKNVDIITLRDDISREELGRMGVTSPDIRLSADPTLILEKAPDAVVDEIFQRFEMPSDTKYIGFGLRKWKNFDKVSNIFAKAGDYVYEKYGIVPVFIPIEYPADIAPAKKVIAQMKHKSILIDDRLPIETTIALLSKMSLVVGIRLHAVMFSAVRGVPVIGVSYDIKVDGFMKYIDATTCIKLDELTEMELCTLIDKCIAGQYDTESAKASDMLKSRESENIKATRELLDKN